MRKELDIKVTGRVQMVMYRDFAQRRAKKLNIVGTAQNQEDGSVHIVAQGEEENLKKYTAMLRKGSTFSRVDSVTIIELSKLNEYKEFNIIF